MHVGVKLLYELAKTPHGFLTKKFPTLRAKSTRECLKSQTEKPGVPNE